MREKLIELIKEKQKEMGISQAELARRAGISANQMYNILSGMNTSIATLESILKVLEVKELKVKL